MMRQRPLDGSTIFAVLWVISASLLVRICAGLSREQRSGGVGFQTKMMLKLYTFKRIN